MIRKAEYDKVAQELEKGLNTRLMRIHWKVSDYDEQLLRAAESRDWWAKNKSVEGITILPKDAFASTLNRFHVVFFVRIEREKLSGNTEVDVRLVTDSFADAISFIRESVSHEIAEMLLLNN